MRQAIELDEATLKKTVGESIQKIICEQDLPSNKLLKATKLGIKRVDEIGISRILSHGKHGFIIVSANRNEIKSGNPNCDLSDEYTKWLNSNGIAENEENVSQYQVQFLNERNQQANDELIKAIKCAGYAYTPVFGGYHGGDNVQDDFEPSYIVYNHKRDSELNYDDFQNLKSFAIECCKRLKQNSIYVQAPNEAPVYLNCNGEPTNTTSSKNFRINRDGETFFTTTKREKRTNQNSNGLTDTPQKFTADIHFENFYAYRGAGSLNELMRRSKSGEIFLFK